MRDRYYLSMLILLTIIAMSVYGGCSNDPSIPENRAPMTPKFPEPASGAEGVDTVTSYSWTCYDPDDEKLDYYIRLEKDGDLIGTYTSNQNQISPLDTLDRSTTYRWRVKSVTGLERVGQGSDVNSLIEVVVCATK